VLKDGSGVFLTHLALGLHERGWDISLVSASKSGDWVEWPHLKDRFRSIASNIYELDFFNRSSPEFWNGVRALMEILKEKSFGILAPQSCVPASACLFARDLLGLKSPIVLTLHSWGINRPDWMDLWDSWALSKVDHICFVSQGYKDALVRRLPFEIDGNKTSVITPGLYIEDSYPSKEALRDELSRRYEVSLSSFWITTLGGISERKGHLELIEGFKLLLEKGYDAHLFIIGPVREKPYFEGLLSLCRDILGRVRFMGQMSDPHSLIKASDVFIFPSRSEGLGLALMEAMALGVPCISSNVEGVKDLVCDGKYALALSEISGSEIARSLIYAIENYSEMLYTASKARERVLKDFSFDRTVRAYENLYLKFLVES